MGRVVRFSTRSGAKSVRGSMGVQAGALCWQVRAGKLRVLMVTSRTTRRWVVPKGWLAPGLKPRESAAQEAWEEAGVRGKIRSKPLGSYRYLKKDVDEGLDLRCQVELFAMKVKDLAAAWPEKGERRRRWMSPRKAADLVWEPELSHLIKKFAAKTT